MNWLLIVILVLIIGNIAWGYKMGFMRIALSLVSWVIVLIACHVVTPVVADVIIEHTPLADVIQETVTRELNEAIEGIVDGVIDDSAMAELESKLPSQLQDAILGEHESIADLITGSGEIQVDTTNLTEGAAYLIALIVVLIVTRIALIIVEMVLGLVSKLPLIGQANALLGLGAGAVKGLVWCWVILTVIAMLAYTGVNTELIALVNEAPVLKWLYDNNPIMNVLAEVL